MALLPVNCDIDFHGQHHYQLPQGPKMASTHLYLLFNGGRTIPAAASISRGAKLTKG